MMSNPKELEISILTQIATVLRDAGMSYEDVENICYGLKKELDQLITSVHDSIYERFKEALHNV